MNIRILLPAAFLFLTRLSFATPTDTTFVERHFTQQQLKADVAYLTGVIARVHPDMYHSIGRDRYQLLVDSVKRALHDSMTECQAWPLLARLVGALNEGHSTFDFPKDVYDRLKNGPPLLFPVLISGFNDGQFVVRADVSHENKLLPGDRISSINGIAIPQLINLLSSYTGGLPSFRAIDVYRNISVCLYLYHIQGPYRVDYLRGGKKYHITLKAVTYQAFRANRDARAKSPGASPEKADYYFSYTGKGYAYLAINTLTEQPAVFEHFLDSCFTVLKVQPVGKLIIDLRKNGGGNSALGEMLLHYITDKPFRMTGGEQWKVSQEYKDQMAHRLNGNDLQKMAYYLNAANGSILQVDPEPARAPVVHPLRYNGKVFVLIGPNTFSSANMLVNTIQDYRLATLVGEPSGEPANDYGELIFLQLPNTGFTFATSTKQFVRANGDTKDRHPVLPQYTITDNFLTSQDEAIEFIQAL